MKIKRGFSWMGMSRRFKVYINNEEVEQLSSREEKDIPQPSGSFTLQFRSMKYDRSKKYYIDSNKKISISVNLSPIVRIMSALASLLLVLFAVFFRYISFNNFVIIVLSFLTIYYTVYLSYTIKNFITFKVYDSNNNIIQLDEVKEIK